MDQISESLTSIRALNMREKSKPERPVALGFVDLKEKEHSRPKKGEEYRIISASSEGMESLESPSSKWRKLDLDVYEFFAEDLPDVRLFGKKNEGLIKINIDTKDPQNLDAESAVATFVNEFKVKDGEFAPGFLYRGVFRNVIFEDWVNLNVDLYELDTDASKYYERIKSIIDGVPEIKDLNVLKGIPYLNLATKLFEGIVRVFGKNADDHVWGEIPLLEVKPLIGGAFLRSGIFILYEKGEGKKDIEVEDLAYKDGYVILKNNKKKLTNHLIFGIRVRPHIV